MLRRRPVDLAHGAPVVVLVHGAMDRAASFGRTMRRLGDLDVVAYDRRGYDTSLGAGISATIDEQAADLAAVVDWSGAGSAVVVGHSFGGTIALRAAAADVRWLVGLGAFESPVPSLRSYRSDGADIALAAADRAGPEAAAEAFYRLVVGDGTWERLRDDDRQRRRAEGAQLVAELLDLRRPAAVPDLDDVRVPVVVGAGTLGPDPWRRSALELADRLPHATLVEIDGAGHGAHLSHPDRYADYVRRCVAGADA